MPAAQPGSSDETRRICRDESRGEEGRVAALHTVRTVYSAFYRMAQFYPLVPNVSLKRRRGPLMCTSTSFYTV